MFSNFNSGLEHFIDVSAMMVSAKDIRHIPPEKRNCFFPNEGQLAFYEEYSLTNCRLECAILEVQKRLGCIPWFLPKVWESCSCSHNSLRGIQPPITHLTPLLLCFSILLLKLLYFATHTIFINTWLMRALGRRHYYQTSTLIPFFFSRSQTQQLVTPGQQKNSASKWAWCRFVYGTVSDVVESKFWRLVRCTNVGSRKVELTAEP